MKRPWRIIATTLFVVATLAGALVGDRVLALSEQTRDNLRLYTELVTVAHERYGAEVSYRDLVFASIQGMLRTLDPHTNFLSPRAYTGMREKQAATFYGLGILVSRRNGQITVMSPIEGTPASRLGIRAGDIISTIEGEGTDTMSLDDAIDLLKGPKGTAVNIEIVRRGLEDPLPMTVERAEIPQTTVRFAYMLTPKTGYMMLTDFNRTSSREIADAIADLKSQGAESLLFDLRNNGGGLLDQAIEIADQFVPSGGAIVETRGRTRDADQAYYAAGRYATVDLPVVVLVNAGSASAAEIVSGAIQDHDVGLIVGTSTWGKGLVQTVYTLPYGAGLALTTAKYYTPSGRLIQRDYSSYYDYLAMTPDLESRETDRFGESQVYYTDLNRKVYGGGGITPDVEVQAEPLSVFEQYLLVRNAFQSFAIDQLSERKVESTDWRPADSLIDEFRAWLIKEDIAPAEDIAEGLAKEETVEYLIRAIRGEIMNARFGHVEQHRAMAEGDVQIQTALELLPRAADLYAQRAALEQSSEQPSRATAAMR